MLHKPKSTSTPTEAQVMEFFNRCGKAEQVEEVLWDMFYGSITNPESPTDVKENEERAWLYRQMKEMLFKIEPPESQFTFDNN